MKLNIYPKHHLSRKKEMTPINFTGAIWACQQFFPAKLNKPLQVQTNFGCNLLLSYIEVITIILCYEIKSVIYK